ncbi:hypothetical protein ACFY8C_13545 [Streptomyces flavochromogenes]|uniref:Uncharacterized protein n=1 Tax=Streptomyces flavochromogenes TaxID=68199 RepID=A0ABW6XPD8_9ACTN
MHRHEGPSRGRFFAGVGGAVVVATAAAGVLIGTYNDRPPWGTDIAYEGGFIMASRIRGYDVDGSRTKALLAGECALMERQGMGGDRAVHDPAAWVDGCLDAAAGRLSRHQGLVR